MDFKQIQPVTTLNKRNSPDILASLPRSVATKLGWAGAGSLLFALYLVQSDSVKPKDRRYLALNMVGSVLSGINAAKGRVWPTVAVNAIWFAISLRSFLVVAYDKNSKDDEDYALLQY